MITSDVLRDEMAMSLHLMAGSYLDQGWPMDVVLAALHKAVDLVPELEADNDA